MAPDAAAVEAATLTPCDDTEATASSSVGAAEKLHHETGGGAGSGTSSSEEDDFGPLPAPASTQKRKRRKILSDHRSRLLLSHMPCATMYEKSYMHRDTVVDVAVSISHYFVMTASLDGVVKFWRRSPHGLDFIKKFTAHVGELRHMTCSWDGLYLGTLGATDNRFNLFDIVSFDIINILRLPFPASLGEFVHLHGAAGPLVALAHSGEPKVSIIDALHEDGCRVLRVLEALHQAPLVQMVFSSALAVVISADAQGALEVWSPSTLKHPVVSGEEGGLKWHLKSATDLYELQKKKTHVVCMTLSPDSSSLACLCADGILRIFRPATGRLVCCFDESIEMHGTAQSDPKMKSLHLDSFDFNRRVAMEKELKGTSYWTRQRLVFDESSTFLFVPTFVGIKIINLATHKLERLLGQAESGLRFLSLALLQRVPDKMKIPRAISTEKRQEEKETYPILVCSAFRKHRVYCFTRREPPADGLADEPRDLLNEILTPEDLHLLPSASRRQGDRLDRSAELVEEATIHTSVGDIVIRLFPKEAPKTVENFVTHSRNGYYDGCIFHRVIKNFMIQTGDPLGNGTGGESIWGGEFEDEFHKNLKHDRPFTVSMANAGPGTNGSQFFITTVPASFLDHKHTVFGRVKRGMDVVTHIENVRTNSEDKPYKEIRILTINATNKGLSDT